MTKRALTKDELGSLGLNSAEIEEALALQRQKKERRYKYIVLLTTSEAERLSEQEGREFVRATEWRENRHPKLTT